MWFPNMFHVQILVLEMLFCARLQKRERFFFRMIPAAAAYFALPYLVPGGFFAPILVWDWFTFGFLFMFLLSGLLLAFCFRMNARQVVFYCCVAHTLQHMIHCLYRMTELIFSPASRIRARSAAFSRMSARLQTVVSRVKDMPSSRRRAS